LGWDDYSSGLGLKYDIITAEEGTAQQVKQPMEVRDDYPNVGNNFKDDPRLVKCRWRVFQRPLEGFSKGLTPFEGRLRDNYDRVTLKLYCS
jgi:hypothetical protein